jgi:hypothetical protein
MEISKKYIIFILARIIAVIFLLVAYTNQPISFYCLLRFIICVVGIYSAYFAFKTKKTTWVLLMSAIAILFNPLFPIYLERSQWELYDGISILILLLSIPSLHLSINDSSIVEKYREPIKTFIWSAALIIFALLFWYHIVGSPFDEFALIQKAKLATGILIDSYEVDTGDERGNVYDVGVYKFSLPDGRKFKAFTKNSSGEREEQVEYLPSNPSINRIKGEGCQSIIEWVEIKIIGGGILLAIFLSPGFILARNGIKEIKNIQIK